MNKTLKQIQSTVFSFLGTALEVTSPIQSLHTFSTEDVPVSAGSAGDIYPICGISPLVSASKEATPAFFSLIETGQKDYEYLLLLNPVITGATPIYSPVPASDSIGAALSTPGDAVLSYDRYAFGGYTKGGGAAGETKISLPPSEPLAPGDSLWLCARSFANNADFLGSLSWTEQEG